ncbi:MAG: serine/threonine-protein kinase, partial [Acidobacteriota bacterium]
MIGRRLNHFKILKKLGSGGMGEVFLAQDERLGRQVALKILPPAMANDPERRQRFEREARAVARLNHPNIVTLHSVEEAQGLHFFTMEWVQGKSLTEWIPSHGLAPAEWCRIAVPLADALAAAHKEGVTHRDLKPANVMISDQGRVKVLDFGLAKLKQEETVSDDDATALADDQLTQVGRVVGTLAYMSPEQAEGKPAGTASDVFSLGILLYQVATGKKPFQGDTHISLLSSILKDDPPSASDLNPRVDAALSAIIHHCLEKDPSRRYPSAAPLHTELQEYQKNLEVSEMLSSQSLLSSALGRSASGKGTPRRKWLAAAALVFLLLAVGLWWALRGPSGGNPPDTTDGRNSLAVFYFQNMTGDPALEWLRTGLADMLVTDLSQSPHIRVLGTDRLYQILDNLGRLDDHQVS